jgi:hypothetical protein
MKISITRAFSLRHSEQLAITAWYGDSPLSENLEDQIEPRLYRAIA